MAGVILIALDRQFAANLLGVFLILICCGVDSVYKVAFRKEICEYFLLQDLLQKDGRQCLSWASHAFSLGNGNCEFAGQFCANRTVDSLWSGHLAMGACAMGELAQFCVPHIRQVQL